MVDEIWRDRDAQNVLRFLRLKLKNVEGELTLDVAGGFVVLRTICAR